MTIDTNHDNAPEKAQRTTWVPQSTNAGEQGESAHIADSHIVLFNTSNDDTNFPQSVEEEILSSVAPQLTAVLAVGHPEYNMPHCLMGQYATNNFFKQIDEQPNHFKQFEWCDGLIFLSNSGCHILCIPDITISACKVRELIISQAHSILVHLALGEWPMQSMAVRF